MLLFWLTDCQSQFNCIHLHVCYKRDLNVNICIRAFIHLDIKKIKVSESARQCVHPEDCQRSVLLFYCKVISNCCICEEHKQIFTNKPCYCHFLIIKIGHNGTLILK